MSIITRPLLSGSIKELSKIQYPVLATQKLDGIRALKIDGRVVSRKFKPIPNHHTRNFLEKYLLDGIDGEIMLQNSNDFNQVQSQVMSFDGQPNFMFCAFDYVKDDLEKPYHERIADLKDWYARIMVVEGLEASLEERDWELDKVLKVVIPVEIHNEKELLEYEARCIEQGYEGVMIRSPYGKYKCGRSTLNEGILLKLKRFKDAEALVVDFKEKMHNENTQQKDAFGLSKRSHEKDGLIPCNTLGSLFVRDLSTGHDFNIGSGFDDDLKKQIWDNREEYRGRIVKYKYQEIGPKGAPRFPVFLGFRHEDDL